MMRHRDSVRDLAVVMILNLTENLNTLTFVLTQTMIRRLKMKMRITNESDLTPILLLQDLNQRSRPIACANSQDHRDQLERRRREVTMMRRRIQQLLHQINLLHRKNPLLRKKKKAKSTI